ncbi:MAG TPA: DUF4256 domain-containing protein [Pelobium sp.]
MKKQLSNEQQNSLLSILKSRFEQNTALHKGMAWEKIQARLLAKSSKLWSLNEMELSGGEPDVIAYDKVADEYLFCDCATESPKGRRSLCYDRAALNSRKENKPKNSAMDVAQEMGVELLSEQQYLQLQKVKNVDCKTSSWVLAPAEIRSLGGAIFCDFRFGRVFTYHNGAESYYASRGFRALLRV